ATRPSAEWLLVLGRHGVPSGPVNTVAEAMQEPHLAARDLLVQTDHPLFGNVKQLASPVRVGPPGADRYGYRRAPARNEHAGQILGDLLGYDASRIDELAAAGAFGTAPGAAPDG
ncbi:MAG TPA: CoA transferase, partial [Nitriliruptorales bacterium]